MSKAKFAYDESGATFFYFVLSFLALILIPSTYYLWPKDQKSEKRKSKCNCDGCLNKNRYSDNLNRSKRVKTQFVRGLLIAGWIAFLLVAYRCATIKHEYVNWDPFEILGVREDATQIDIKKAYRRLSLKYHPDKDTGDSDRFVKITKAYAALTDDEARKNWELYGNPDGPGATSFGIALPSWIIEKENSFVVLGIYALIFMVALPVSVGLWWYKSVKFGDHKVLINTSELYYYFIHKTPHMALKRLVMILAASLEFSKTHNPEVIERPTDNQEVPRLIRDLPNLGEKNKERPLCFSYSIKSRAIIHAHLSRMKLPQTTLEVDRRLIISKCPYLLQDFVNCVAQMITLAMAGRVQNMPNISTLENGMKLGPLIVQALWEYQNPLLQLPHFSEDTLRYLERKKVKISSIDQLAKMKEPERREALKNFSDDQFEDINTVLMSMPQVHIQVKLEVLDDEDPSIITAGSIVTASVNLTRQTLGHTAKDVKPNNNELETQKLIEDDNEDDEWDRKFQERVLKRQKVFDSKPRISHPVHCPYYPGEKEEFWWVYIVDRKNFALITAPLLLTNLVEKEEVELKFTVPRQGNYSYTVVVRSDSYVDCVVQKSIMMEVKPAREYIIPEDEEELDAEERLSSGGDSDMLTDDDED